MGREVRRVPPGWQHPKNAKGHHIPLKDGFNKALAEWDEDAAQWSKGFRRNWFPKDGEPEFTPKDADMTGTYEEWSGKRPAAEDYMPDWPEAERTHWQMYETCSEGTPISPVMETPEALARWLVDNGASAFGRMTASYEAWLATIKAGSAVSAVIVPGRGMFSGVEMEGAWKP